MRAWLSLFFLLSCASPKGGNSLPVTSSPKDAALSFIDALRHKRCEVAVALVDGGLKATYQKMIAAQNLEIACESWRTPYLPYDRMEYAFEEPSGEHKRVWIRMYRSGTDFDAVYIEVERRGDRWWVVGV